MDLEGKRILVIGGTGSLGRTLVSRLLKGELGRPAKIIILSRDEAKQYFMRLEYFQQLAPSQDNSFLDPQKLLTFRIGDVRDYASVLYHLRDVDVVFNAAAMKHVPICEYAPFEGVLTNIVGAHNIVRAIRENDLRVELVVGVSTDKACKPVNVMGMTKAIQERIFMQANLGNAHTRFVCVRYGNVVASRGSVVPLFMEQIRHGGPVTVTLESMTRFLLTLDKAVDTVFEAVRSGLPGETYVPKVPAAKVVDIARSLINGTDIPIVSTGIRPGEKIHESLVSEEECFRTIERNGYYVILPLLPELRNGSIREPTLQSEYSSSNDLIGVHELDQLLAPYRVSVVEPWRQAQIDRNGGVQKPVFEKPEDRAGVSQYTTTQTHQIQENPLVSVVIPCYNAEVFIADAIESVLAQTYDNLEILITNDGSSDGTEAVIKHYLNNPKVRYFKHETNRGIPAARNTAIRQARGEYVAFLDSDDTWLPNKIEAQLQVFSRDVTRQVGLVWSDAYMKDNRGNIVTRGGIVPDDIGSLPTQSVLKRLFLRNFICAVTAMVRRSCFDRVGLLDEALRGGSDDYDLWLRLAPYFRFAYIPVPLAVVRLQHGGNHTSVERHFQDLSIILPKAISQNPELAQLLQEKLAEWHCLLGIDCLEKGNKRDARSHLRESIIRNPFLLKPMVAWILASCGPVGRQGLRRWRQLRTLAAG
jgi:UDP-glucose 4-epimerase